MVEGDEGPTARASRRQRRRYSLDDSTDELAGCCDTFVWAGLLFAEQCSSWGEVPPRRAGVSDCESSYALQSHGSEIKRVAIFDWDLHHGNGTEEIVSKDTRILYISMHRSGEGFYPGALLNWHSDVPPETGQELEITPNLVNVPLDPGVKACCWLYSH